jgi:hypothetical protein
MLLYNAGLENHPDGSGNLNAIVNGNWGNLNAMFNPAQGRTASQTGTALTATADTFTSDDVGATIRFADGTVDVVAAYVSVTQLTMTTSQTVASQAFELYRIGENQRDGLFRGLYKRPRVGTAENARFPYYDDTTDKFIPSVMYQSSGDIVIGTGDLIMLSGNIGVRESNPGYPIHVEWDSSGIGTEVAIFAKIDTIHTSSNATSVYYANMAKVQLDHASGVTLSSPGGINGQIGQVILNNTGTTTNVNCITALYSNEALGTVGNVALFTAKTSKTAAAAITNLYAFFVPTQSWTGTITNRWGVYVQDATSKNVFAGDTGIGTAPSYRFHTVESGQPAGTDFCGVVAYTLTHSSTTAGPACTALKAELVLTQANTATLSNTTLGQSGLLALVRPTIASNTTSRVQCLQARFDMDVASNVTTLSLIRADFSSSAAGAITTFSQFHAPSVAFGSTTATNKYAIWQEDTALVNRLEGPLQGNLPSGELYVYDATLAAGITASATWTELTSGLSSRNLYKMTLVSAHALDVDYAGDYLAIWSVSFTGTSLNDYEGGLIINSSTATVYAHAKRTASTASAHGSFGASAKITLAASDEISLAFQNVGATNDLTISHLSLTLIRIAN